nr:unnamed protein product [Callosobruchus analis]
MKIENLWKILSWSTCLGFFFKFFQFQSDDISQALYDANWLSASRRFKTAILITMARIQTPLYLTIGKFVPMTLSVSVAVIL